MVERDRAKTPDNIAYKLDKSDGSNRIKAF